MVGQQAFLAVVARGVVQNKVCQLVNWCFKLSQPQRAISGLKETFMTRYVVERTNKAEIRTEDKSEKVESCKENLRNEIQLKGP